MATKVNNTSEREFIQSQIDQRLTWLKEQVEEHEADIENYHIHIEKCKESIKDYKKEIKYLKTI